MRVIDGARGSIVDNDLAAETLVSIEIEGRNTRPVIKRNRPLDGRKLEVVRSASPRGRQETQ